ncbi:MAG: nuclear transport factor 2 family protein [Acidimicrobiia bacterium]
MTTLDELCATDEIQRLKARYCRAVDHKDWDALGNVFTADAKLFHGETGIDGCDAIVAVIRDTLADFSTSHCAHTPLIDITGATTATGNWGAIYTRVGDPPSFGEYDEDHELGRDGSWRIRCMRLTDALS